MDFSVFLDERPLALLKLAIVLCGSRAAREDVLQEVLLRAYQQRPRIGGLDSPYGYVRTMVVNEHLSWRRRSVPQIPRAEIADTLRCAPVTVRSYVSRGLAALRNDLAATEHAGRTAGKDL